MIFPWVMFFGVIAYINQVLVKPANKPKYKVTRFGKVKKYEQS